VNGQRQQVGETAEGVAYAAAGDAPADREQLGYSAVQLGPDSAGTAHA